MFKVGNVTPAADRVPDGHYCTTREAQNGVVWLDWDKANEEVKVGLLNKSNHTYTNTHRERENITTFSHRSPFPKPDYVPLCHHLVWGR